MVNGLNESIVNWSSRISSSAFEGFYLFSNTYKAPWSKKKPEPRLDSMFKSLPQRQTSESLYDLKLEEPAPVVTASVNATKTSGSYSLAVSCFKYVVNVQFADTNAGSRQVINHVSAPNASTFFEAFGMDNRFQKKSSSGKPNLPLMTKFWDDTNRMPRFLQNLIFLR